MTLYAFLSLAAAICTIGVSSGRSVATPPSDSLSGHLRVVYLPLMATTALVLALLTGLITVFAAMICSMLAVLAVWLGMPSTSGLLRRFGWMLLAVTSLAAALHLLPGFQNPLLVNAQQLTPDAIPYTLYANFDKGWAGYCLLLALWPAQQRLWQPLTEKQAALPLFSSYWRGFWPVWPLTVLLAMGLAISLGLIKFAPKWPDFALQFIFCNLLLTCVAEEAFFRGLLQQPLYNLLKQRGFATNTAAWSAIIAVSLLFGVVHLAGGIEYALVATVASIGYGWAYQRSGRIEVAIAAHFALNLLHLSLFTYPMLK